MTLNRPLRIAQISPLILPLPAREAGGTERIVVDLSYALNALGHQVTVFASADSDLDLALKIGLETIARQDFILDDPEADAWIEELGDSNVVLYFVGWIDQSSTNWAKARSEAMRLVKRALESNGFSLPEPIYRLRFDDDDLKSALSGFSGTEEKRVAPAPKKVREETAVPQNTDIDPSLQRRMERERRSRGRGDLLSETAPTEFESE